MKLGPMLKLHGNLNRIAEFNVMGASYRIQAVVFQEYDIDVTAEQLSTTCFTNDQLSRKALPKKAVRMIEGMLDVMRKYELAERALEADDETGTGT